MKKLIALIAILATVSSFTACKSINMSPEEKMSKYLVEESERVAASIQAENDYIDGVNKYSEETIGKTIKGKKLVIKDYFSLGYQYKVYEFDKKGVFSKHYVYKFYDDVKTYEGQLEIGNVLSQKIVDKDPKARMIVYEIKEDLTYTFDDLYDMFSKPENIERGYTIVE